MRPACEIELTHIKKTNRRKTISIIGAICTSATRRLARFNLSRQVRDLAEGFLVGVSVGLSQGDDFIEQFRHLGVIGRVVQMRFYDLAAHIIFDGLGDGIAIALEDAEPFADTAAAAASNSAVSWWEQMSRFPVLDLGGLLK